MSFVHVVLLVSLPPFIASLKFDKVKVYSEQLEELTRYNDVSNVVSCGRKCQFSTGCDGFDYCSREECSTATCSLYSKTTFLGGLDPMNALVRSNELTVKI